MRSHDAYRCSPSALLVGAARVAAAAVRRRRATTARRRRQRATSRAGSRSTAIWTGDGAEGVRAVIKAFNKLYPDVKVKYKPVGDNLADRALDRRRRAATRPTWPTSPSPGSSQIRRQGRAQADRLRARTRSRELRRRRRRSSGRSTGSSTASSSRRPTSRPSGTTSRPSRTPASRPPEDLAAVPRRRRRRSRPPASRRTRSAARTAGRSPTCSRTSTSARPGPDEVRPALDAQDQVDRPVGQGRAEDDGRGVSATRSNMAGGTSGALQTDFPTSVSNVFSDEPEGGDGDRGRLRPRRRVETRLEAGRGLQRVRVPVDRRLAAVGRRRRRHDRRCSGTRPATQAFVEFLATPEAADGLGEARRLLDRQQEHAAERLSGRDHARRPRRRSRKAEDVPLRHVRPAARRVRRDRRAGRVGALPGLPAEPERRRRDRAAARGRGGEGLQAARSGSTSAREHHGGAAAAAAAPPGRRGRRPAGAATRVAAGFLAPALVLLGVWIVYPTIYTIVRSFFGRTGSTTSSGSTTTRRSSRRHADDRDQEQRDLGRGRAGVRDRDRAHLRRPDRAGQLVGRVQDGRLHADGDLRVRRRRDLADHVRAGPDLRRGQRRDRRSSQDAVSARPACSPTARAVDRRRSTGSPEQGFVARRRRSARAASRCSG